MLTVAAARLAPGLREMMVEEGGANEEVGGSSPSGSGFLQQVGMLRPGACRGDDPALNLQAGLRELQGS